jgi:hypothetical protein
LGRREINQVRRSQSPKKAQKQSQNQNPSIVRIVGGMGTLLSFASGGSVRKGWLERWPTRTGTTLLVVCLSLGWCREVRVWCVPFTLERGVILCLEVSHHREKVVGVLGLGVVSLLDIPSLVANTSMGGTIAVLGPKGATGHGLPFRVRVVLQGDVWVFHLGEMGWILLTTHLRTWNGTGLIHFVLTPVPSHLLTLALIFYFAGGRHGGLLVDRLWLLLTHDQRSKLVLQPHPTDDQIVHHFGDNGKGRVLSVGTMKVSESVTFRRVFLVNSLGYNLFPSFLMRVLKSMSKQVVLVFWTLEVILCARLSLRVRYFQSRYFSVCWLLSLLGCWCFGGALEMA